MFASAKVLITYKRPCSDRSIVFQQLKHVLMLAILLYCFFFLSTSILAYPRCTPKALMVLLFQLIFAKLSFLFHPLPSHRPSVLSLLRLSPEIFPKSSTIFSPFIIASSLAKKRVKTRVVSSASCNI